MPEPMVSRTRHAGVALLTIDRPEALNALSVEVVDKLSAALEAAEEDPRVRAIVITGSDRAFCAGADIEQIPSLMESLVLEPLPFERLFHTLAGLLTPTVAAVRGLAFGGGCELALACDIVVAGRSARFALPEVRLGLIPGAGGTQRLVHAVGKSKAMLMLLTGAPVDAEWAYTAGLIAELTADESVVSRALEIAGVITENAPRAVQLAADSGRGALESPLARGLQQERRNFMLLLATEDAREGVAAFRDRRPPQFTGR